MQHYTVTPYSCKLTHLSHLLHAVPTMVICDWPETRWRLDVVRWPTKMRPRSTQSMRSTTGALWALGFGLFMALGIAMSDIKTQHCHTLHSGFKHVSYFSFLWNASRWMMWRFHFSCLDGEDYPNGRICLLYTCMSIHIVCTWNHIGSFKQFQC